MSKILLFAGKLGLVCFAALYFLWDAIPAAKCGDETASLYTPQQMMYLAYASRGVWGRRGGGFLLDSTKCPCG